MSGSAKFPCGNLARKTERICFSVPELGRGSTKGLNSQLHISNPRTNRQNTLCTLTIVKVRKV